MQRQAKTRREPKIKRNKVNRFFRALDLFKLKPRNRQLPTTEPKPRLLRLTVTGQTIGISIGDGSA